MPRHSTRKSEALRRFRLEGLYGVSVQTDNRNLSLVNAVLRLGPEITGARRLLLIVLATRVNEEGWCEATRADLGRDIGVKHPDKVALNLAWLERRGHVKREARFGEDGARLPSRYWLLTTGIEH